MLHVKLIEGVFGGGGPWNLCCLRHVRGSLRWSLLSGDLLCRRSACEEDNVSFWKF